VRAGPIRRFADRALLTTWRACVEFVDDRGHRSAAEIGFFALLSFVPLAMLLVGAFGLVFDDDEIRSRVVTAVFDNLPLAQESDRTQLERAISDALDRAGDLGVLSVLLLIVAATGVMGALRHAINQAWDLHRSPSVLQRKALDLALVVAATIVVVFALSLSAQRDVASWLDDTEAGGSVADVVLQAAGELLSLGFTALVILFLYRVLPWPRPKVHEIWPGAVVAALLIGLVRGLLELYFDQLADFGALYGSLGALMALLLFVYASALVIVFGAEFASEWSRLPDQAEVDRRVQAGWRRVREGLRRRARSPN
jgi:membrane protein